ncbi:MAG: hypothetical protein V4618_17310 [Pseudomonadota bacterium]
MATKSTTTRSRTAGTPSTARRRTTTASAKSGTAAKKKAAPRTQALTDEAKTAIRSVRTRATRAVKKVPTDRTTLSIAAGVLAGVIAAGVAMFMNRDRLKDVAATSGDKLRKAADDLSVMAHDRIDQARDNITRFRARANGDTDVQPEAEKISIQS